MANQIAGGALDTQIGPPAGARETADLAVDLERMFHRLTSSLGRSQRLADEATEARDAMRRFLADASHETRTPPTSLTGYSDLYARNMLNEPGHLDRAMDRVGSESARLTALVNDTLQLASNGVARHNEDEAVNVMEVAGHVVDDLNAAFSDQQIELRHDTGGPAMVRGDRDRLDQCLLDLGANACQHASSADDVQFEVRTSNSGVAIAVVDHGPGIDPELAETIFLPFYRGVSSRARDGGDGTTFVLTIPALDARDGRDSSATSPAGVTPQRNGSPAT